MNTSPIPMITPEILIPRLGEQLVSTGLLSAEQLQQALNYQRQCMDRGRQLLLGQAIMEMGFLDRPTLDRAVTEQIMQLRAALEDANHNLEQRVQQRTLELEKALRRLAQTNQLKANFVANVSHELRTPLTHIRGYLDLLYAESLGDLNPDQKKALGVSLQSSMRLQNLIDDLILFSQAARGEMTLTLGPVDLNRLAVAIVDRLKPRSEDRQLTFEASIEASLPLVQADEEKLSWVITQLMDNAIKFTNPGGKVSLKMSTDPSANNLIILSVSDTGIGISPEHVREIFEPFHQLDGSASRRYGGTGLGLTLVLQIIEAHGSLIDVQSEPGKGTTISFPLLTTKEE
ncbi:MAG TPA: ATP-binding protein [Anaerolineales bacterium]